MTHHLTRASALALALAAPAFAQDAATGELAPGNSYIIESPSGERYDVPAELAASLCGLTLDEVTVNFVGTGNAVCAVTEEAFATIDPSTLQLSATTEDEDDETEDEGDPEDTTPPTDIDVDVDGGEIDVDVDEEQPNDDDSGLDGDGDTNDEPGAPDEGVTDPNDGASGG